MNANEWAKLMAGLKLEIPGSRAVPQPRRSSSQFQSIARISKFPLVSYQLKLLPIEQNPATKHTVCYTAVKCCHES